MALILSIETGTEVCSVALAKDGEMISLRESSGEGRAHANNLALYIEEVLRGNEINGTRKILKKFWKALMIRR